MLSGISKDGDSDTFSLSWASPHKAAEDGIGQERRVDLPSSGSIVLHKLQRRCLGSRKRHVPHRTNLLGFSVCALSEVSLFK